MTAPQGNGVDTRIARLEASVTAFIEGQQRTNTQLADSVEKIARTQSEAGRPQYILLIGLVGILMSIGQAALSPVKAQVESNRSDLVQAETRTVKSLEKMDERLQREFNLINDKTDNKVKDLDRVSADRHADAVARMADIRSFQERQVERELNELAVHRLRSKP